MMSTDPTPSTCWISGRMRSSMNVRTSDRPLSPDRLRMAKVTTGVADGSNLLMIGSMISRGRLFRMEATFSRTSVAAIWASFSRTKLAMIIETPSDEVELIVSTPLIVLRTSSIGLLIWDSISSGPTPGLATVTATIGREMSGMRSTPRRE